jgi:cation transport ATPase
MGRAGADPALETALSRRARHLITANPVSASAFITGLVASDLLGSPPLPLCVLGHEGATIIVGLNGLRLRSAGA